MTTLPLQTKYMEECKTLEHENWVKLTTLFISQNNIFNKGRYPLPSQSNYISAQIDPIFCAPLRDFLHRSLWILVQ